LHEIGLGHVGSRRPTGAEAGAYLRFHRSNVVEPVLEHTPGYRIPGRIA
jgi:hypothetical protein